MALATEPDDSAGLQSLLPSAQAAVDRAADLLQLIAGLTVFGLSGLSLLIQRPLPAGDVVALVIPMLVWVGSYAFANGYRRARVQLGSFALLLASVWWVPVSATQVAVEWIQLGDVAFAMIVVAAMALPVRQGLIAVAITVSLDVAVTLYGEGSRVTADHSAPFLGELAGPLYLVIVGTGFTLWRGRWSQQAVEVDTTFEATELALATRRESIAQRNAQQAALRRIHETTLNTLLAVSKGIRAEHVSLLREMCADALRDTRWAPTVALVPLHELVHVEHMTNASELGVYVSTLPDIHVHEPAASALRDAVVEAVRNAERHADARLVTIDTRIDDQYLDVTIRDDGRGIEPGTPEGFGMQRTIVDSLLSVGGDAQITSIPGRGTTVRLHLPVTSSDWTPTPSPALNQATGLLSSRLMAISPLFYAIALLGLILSTLTNPWAVGVAFVAFIACVIGNVAWWNRTAGDVSGLLAPVALALTFLALAWPSTFAESPTCASTAPLTFFLDGGLGSLIIITLGLGRRRLFWLAGAVMSIAALWASLRTGPGCAPQAALAFAGTLMYLGVVLVIASRVFRAADDRRIAATTDWASTEARRVRAASSRTYAQTQAALPSSALQFLTGLADGSIDPTTTAAQERAGSEAAAVRGYLASNATALAAPDNLSPIH